MSELLYNLIGSMGMNCNFYYEIVRNKLFTFDRDIHHTMHAHGGVILRSSTCVQTTDIYTLSL